MAPDEKGVSTSSGETTVRGEGEPIRTDPLRGSARCACDLEARGPRLSCLHLKWSFAPAATPADEQVAGHEELAASSQEP